MDSTASTSYSHFTPPPSLTLPPNSVAIEFCDRCRWQHRASWCQTELLVTFGPKFTPASKDGSTEEAKAAAEGSGSKAGSSGSGSLSCVALLPRVEEDSAGRFRVWVYHHNDDGGDEGGAGVKVKVKATCVYDRKTMGRFPEMKELKQLVRDIISPGASLGHSDKKVGGQMEAATTAAGNSAATSGEQGQAA